MLAQVERARAWTRSTCSAAWSRSASGSAACREAMAYAARAARPPRSSTSTPHTGWFITAVAELAGGDLTRAPDWRERGIAARRGARRHPLPAAAPAAARPGALRGGEAGPRGRRSADPRRSRPRNGIGDPTVNRWQAELVSALVALGDLDEADGAGRGGPPARWTAAPAPTAWVPSWTGRRPSCCCARGDVAGRAMLLDRSAKVCADLGMRVDLGRCAAGPGGHVERRRRRAPRPGGARGGVRAVRRAHALSWRARPGPSSARRAARALAGDPRDLLTETEARVAREVGRGASNREIAERLYLSVKTVEATLTRVYRKLDVRSRTQLAARVSAHDSAPSGGS